MFDPELYLLSFFLPLHKGKERKKRCEKHRGVSLLSILGKMDGGALINYVEHVTEPGTGEEPGRYKEEMFRSNF